MPPLEPGLQLLRAVLVLVATIAGCLLLEVVLVGAVQQRSAQQGLFDRFRAELASGTAPAGGRDPGGRPWAPGTPVAYLEIPSIGLRQIVVEGTSASVLFRGPGHRPDSVFPGQPGVSVLYGRRGAFGGPFRAVSNLHEGTRIRVTTGQGRFAYRVTRLRRAGDQVPRQSATTTHRLVLTTADGSPFVPTGVLRVDADLVGAPAPGAAVPAPAAPADQLMRADTSALWRLALLLQALAMLLVGGAWAWHRWHPVKAWIVLGPPTLLFGLLAATETARLLPNLL